MHNDQPRSIENFEHSDMHLKIVLATGLTMIIIAVGGFGIGYVIMRSLNEMDTISGYVKSDLQPVHGEWPEGIRLQTAPWLAYDEFEVLIEHERGAYEILSEQPLILRIPIEVAMDLVEAPGLPEFPAAATLIAAPASPVQE